MIAFIEHALDARAEQACDAGYRSAIDYDPGLSAPEDVTERRTADVARLREERD